ncbi:hypothetical protein MPSEU_000794500 [Mayamaea pseudoterrestris]|nr:hypothetical protein MPSEU_000794500 [Mayamaea pseudoterrestris]
MSPTNFNESFLKIKFTVADLVSQHTTNPETAIVYHVMDSGFAAFSAVGNLLGVAAYAVRRRPSLLVSMGTASLALGAFGAVFGYVGLQEAKKKNDPNFPAWDEEGIELRANGILHNERIRVMDALHWTGMGVAAGALMLARLSPSRLGYSAGALGVAQVLSHGSAIGTTLALGAIAADMQKEKKLNKELELDDE